MLRIAIVAPSSHPFSVGGAEKLWWGLLEHINQDTPHVADLVKLPSPESDLVSLVGSYADFSRLDLSGFDLVISSKYPAWMVSHPRHVCYLQHRLRGLYDTYNERVLGRDPPRHPAVDRLLALMREEEGRRAGLAPFLDAFADLAARSDLPAGTLAFPGPLARDVVRFLDDIGLARHAIARFATIAKNVTRREHYFPEGVAPAISHHPSNLKGLREGPFDYVFTASRLDGPKRVELIVRAMAHVKADVKLKVAGTGPLENQLREIARDDPRVEFLGFVRDQDLAGLYAGALVVPFVPCDEDYGLVTIEAMACAKPVIATDDSGGPLEFVEDGVNGFVVPPRPDAIAARIDELARDRGRAREMGAQGRRRVAGVTWEATLAVLLEGLTAPRSRVRRRRRIVVANTYPVVPPRSGGQARIFNLYGQLAERHDVELVCFTEPGAAPSRREVRRGFTETRIPPFAEHVEAEKRLREETGFLQIGDIAMLEIAGLTPGFGEALGNACRGADFTIASHPYLLPALRKATSLPFGHESQNVEQDMKRAMLPDNPASRRLLERLADAEGSACRDSLFVLACSNEDRDRLAALYGADAQRFIFTPNGVDVRTTPLATPARRHALRERLGIRAAKLALFMGSWHKPNVEALERVCALARLNPGISFLAIGSSCQAPLAAPQPANVRLLGIVDEETKQLLFECADVALNPMSSGSGTNVKMLDWLASGLPVITSPVGARGLALEPGRHVIVAEPDAFAPALERFFASDDGARDALARASREHVEAHFDWRAIAARVEEAWIAMGIA
jgi:glycosyltransferase involved in cell wall biosynthesis